MKYKLFLTFGFLALAMSGLPCVCSAQCGPDFIEIDHKIPNRVFAPGANPGPAHSSATVYRLRIVEQREFWSTPSNRATLPTLAGRRYYAHLPPDVFMSLWKTSPDYAKLTKSHSAVVSAGNNISLDMFQKFMVSGGIPLLVSFEDSVTGGRSKTLNLAVRKWTALPAAPAAAPGQFVPTTIFGLNAQPFEASNEYSLTIPFRVADNCK
jgi:hypothetical protein